MTKPVTRAKAVSAVETVPPRFSTLTTTQKTTVMGSLGISGFNLADIGQQQQALAVLRDLGLHDALDDQMVYLYSR